MDKLDPDSLMREMAGRDDAQWPPSRWSRSRSAMRWPVILAILLYSPLVLGLAQGWAGYGGGHPPLDVFILLYAACATPVLAPLGLFLSVRAMRRGDRSEWLPWLLACLFALPLLVLLFALAFQLR